MPQEYDARPVEVLSLSLWFAFGKERGCPLVVWRNSTQCGIEVRAECDQRPFPIDEGRTQELFPGKIFRLYDFHVFRQVYGVLVVFGMACPEVMVIVPAEEGKDAHEQPVQGAGFEYRVVNQFMKPVD